jgi:alpha-L-fucosidase
MTLYLHVFEWPAEGRLLVPAPPGRVTGVTLFETQEPLESESTEEGLVVYLPATPLNPINTVIRVEVENGEKVPVAPASEGGGDAPVM